MAACSQVSGDDTKQQMLLTKTGKPHLWREEDLHKHALIVVILGNEGLHRVEVGMANEF